MSQRAHLTELHIHVLLSGEAFHPLYRRSSITDLVLLTWCRGFLSWWCPVIRPTILLSCALRVILLFLWLYLPYSGLPHAKERVSKSCYSLKRQHVGYGSISLASYTLSNTYFFWCSSVQWRGILLWSPRHANLLTDLERISTDYLW